MTVPQHKWLWSYADEYALHKRRYTKSDMECKAGKAGFKVEFLTSFVSLLLPLMLISRRRKMTKQSFDPIAEFKIGKSQNNLLEKIMDMERFFIKKGVPLPLGGSLLLVAKKTRR